MRKTLVVTSLLLVLSIGFVSITNSIVLNQKDQVSYTDSILYGDASMAEGITVESKTHFDRRLFWDTTYHAGENPSTKTDYLMYSSQQPRPIIPDRGITLESSIADTYEVIYGENETTTAEIPIIFSDLYKELTPGETKTATIRLKDYFDYYPFRADITLRNGTYNYFSDSIWDDDGTGIQTLFHLIKIPVLEEETLAISVTKDDSGEYLFDWDYTETGTDSYDISAYSAVGKDKLFFTINQFTQNGKLIDTSQIPEGFGIYAFPFEENSMSDDSFSYDSFQMDELANVYPLNPKEQIYSLTLSEDLAKLFLITEDLEQEGTRVTILDTETMETLQTIHIDAIKNRNVTELLVADTVFAYDDFLVLYCSDNYIVVIEQDKNGQYQLDFVTKLSSDAVISDYIRVGFLSNYIDMDWNGKELVLVEVLDQENSTFDTHYHYTSPGFQISIFDKDGLKYFSQHKGSLDVGFDSYEDYEVFVEYQRNEEPPLTVCWDSNY